MKTRLMKFMQHPLDVRGRSYLLIRITSKRGEIHTNRSVHSILLFMRAYIRIPSTYYVLRIYMHI